VVLETFCFMCGKAVRTTDDDDTPRCDKCQGEWADAMAVQAIMDGEIPIPPEEVDDDQGDEEGEDDDG